MLMEIIRGKIKKPERIVVYGPEGIGKSTFASMFPDPLFIDTEGSTSDLDVARLPAPESWAMIVEEVNYVKEHPDCCKTLVIDTADWAEKLCIKAVCASEDKRSVEDFSYGKGYVKVAEQFGRFLNALTDISDLGITIVVTAHAMMRKFERPDESGAYDRWELKLEKKTSPLLKEWATMLLFANYKTIVVKDSNGKAKAKGGERVMYTQHHACWDAKNRKGLPEEMPFQYEQLKMHFDIPENKTVSKPEPEKIDHTGYTYPQAQPPAPKQEEPEEPKPVKQEKPKATDPLSQLRQLMENGMWSEQDIQKVVASHGYYPESVPISSYAPEFIEGALIGAWEQVEAALKAQLEKDIPF